MNRPTCPLSPARGCPPQVAAAATARPMHAEAAAGRQRKQSAGTRARRIAGCLWLGSALAASARFPQTKGGTMKVIASGPPGTDGMTLLVAANNVATINPFVFSKLKYSFADDQITVRHFGGGYVLVANRPATTARHGSASARRAGRGARRST
jgi:hypothetical protein